MRKPLITFTTDFGTADSYAGTMKGVILTICPGATLIDISHALPAFEPCAAAFLIAQVYPYYPRNTIHLCIVDPGVGSARRPILVEAAGQFFVGPDNGIFTMVFQREKHRVRELTADRYFRQPVSQTFHGRDVFSPVAAHLASGVRPASFGKLIDNHLRSFLPAPVRTSRRAWTGAILHTDKFGNLVTNFEASGYAGLDSKPFELQVGMRSVKELVRSYAEGPAGEPFVIVGSSGYLEVAVRQESAAKLLGVETGAPVELTMLG